MEKLRYKKISEFLETLNNREKKYILKKIEKDLMKNILTVDFTFNGQRIYKEG